MSSPPSPALHSPAEASAHVRILSSLAATGWSRSPLARPAARWGALVVLALGCGSTAAEPVSPSIPAAVPAPASAPAPAAPAVGTIVAVGDLHGDLDATLAVLQLAGLVDAEGHWAAGSTTFVQTGDTTDRGPDSKEVLELMAALMTEAEAAGGRVVPLLGNHEAMNLQGDWRYVSAGDVADFGSAEARRAAFSATGPLGAWLRQRDLVAKVGDTVFVHGGVSPTWAARGLDAINTAGRRALGADPRSPVLGAEGPLWLRDYLQAPESIACPALAEALAALDARRMVVGHTTQRSGQVATRCGGSLLGIDTGISAHYGGHLAAVRIEDGDAWAVYPSGRVDLPDPPGR